MLDKSWYLACYNRGSGSHEILIEHAKVCNINKTHTFSTYRSLEIIKCKILPHSIILVCGKKSVFHSPIN